VAYPKHSDEQQKMSVQVRTARKKGELLENKSSPDVNEERGNQGNGVGFRFALIRSTIQEMIATAVSKPPRKNIPIPVVGERQCLVDEHSG